MRFLVAIVVCLVTSSAAALDQLEAPKPVPACCACGDQCPCDVASCMCPKLVTFENGDKALWIPAPMNVKDRWPFQGPFLWTGQAGRWVLGAPRRGR